MIPLLHEVLKTPSNKIELAPLHITADVGRLTSRVDAANDPENTLVTGLVLTSRRHLRSKNSWMHNINVLVKGKDRCTLLIHPSDAEAAPSPQAVSGAAYGHSL
jgi:anaerobic selenocysteine-containing dehydrogenase